MKKDAIDRRVEARSAVVQFSRSPYTGFATLVCVVIELIDWNRKLEDDLAQQAGDLNDRLEKLEESFIRFAEPTMEIGELVSEQVKRLRENHESLAQKVGDLSDQIEQLGMDGG